MGSLNSSPGFQDARHGTSNFARRELQGCRALLGDSSAQSGVRSPPPLPPGATRGARDLNPMSQGARLPPGSFVRRGGLSGPTLARMQQGCRAAPIGGGAHARVGLPSPLPPGAARGSQDSRAVASPIRQRVTGGQRHQERSDLMVTEPVQGQGGTALGRDSKGAAAPPGLPTEAETATGVRRRAMSTVPAEGFISTRTRARTRINARAGARSSNRRKRRQPPIESLEKASRQQPRTTRMTSSTTFVDPPPSPPEPSPDMPRLPRRAQ